MTLASLTEVTVASRDIPAAVDFCRRAFELEVLADGKEGTVVGARGVPFGHVRLVAASSDPAVAPPVPWEIGCRVLGIKPRDIERSRARVIAAGASPTPIARYEVAPGQPTVEYWVAGPDDVIWELPFSQRGSSPALDADPARDHSEPRIVGIATESVDQALEVYAGAGGMKVLFDADFSGEAMTTLMGLPDGGTVRAAVTMGTDAGTTMILELWEFRGVDSVRRPERQVGLRRITFDVDDPADLGDRLAGAGARLLRPGLLVGPAGVEIELRAYADRAQGG